MSLIAILILITSLGTPPFATFTHVEAEAQRAPSSVSVQLRTPWTKQFRSELALQATHRADFANHYVLAKIGCGASCLTLAAIDKRDGSVVELPQTLCCWPDEVMEPLRYRAKSRLLIAQGQLNEKGPAGVHRFVLRSGRFYELPGHPALGLK